MEQVKQPRTRAEIEAEIYLLTHYIEAGRVLEEMWEKRIAELNLEMEGAK